MAKCKDCALMETDGFSYCLGKDLYTEVTPGNEACSDFIDKEYRCNDCYFFDKGICKAVTGEYRYADKSNEACDEFEYKRISKQ